MVVSGARRRTSAPALSLSRTNHHGNNGRGDDEGLGGGGGGGGGGGSACGRRGCAWVLAASLLATAAAASAWASCREARSAPLPLELKAARGSGWDAGRGAGAVGDPSSSRFPRPGTSGFAALCPWAEAAAAAAADESCAYLVRPGPNGTEGLALWVSNSAMAALSYAQILGGRGSGIRRCRVRADYGPLVDVGEVLVPLGSPAGRSAPGGLRCRSDPPGDSDGDGDGDGDVIECLRWWAEPGGTTHRFDVLGETGEGGGDKEALAPVPFYRFAYNPRYDRLRQSDFAKLERTLMESWNGAGAGVRVEAWDEEDEGEDEWDGGGAEISHLDLRTAFGCAIGSLFDLDAAGAARYQPGLNTVILPALRDPANLVLGIYIRTGEAEGRIRGGGKQDTEPPRRGRKRGRCTQESLTRPSSAP